LLYDIFGKKGRSTAMNIEQVLAMDEYQIFDRKSIQVAPTSLVKALTVCVGN
jgi:hypothetical protein